MVQPQTDSLYYNRTVLVERRPMMLGLNTRIRCSYPKRVRCQCTVLSKIHSLTVFDHLLTLFSFFSEFLMGIDDGQECHDLNPSYKGV